MGSLRKMGAFLGLVAHDEPGDAEYGYDDEEYGSRYDERGTDAAYAPAFAPRQLREPVARASAPAAAEPVVQGALAMQVYPQTHRSAESAVGSRPLTVKLTGFAEARVIGERYREGSSVILDMTDLTDGDARRVVDFAAGLAFALHGSIDKVTARVFMLLPPHVDLSAEDRRAFAASSWGRE